MIIGVGADLCDIRRIQTSLDRFGDRFKQRCFTELERTRSDRKPDAAWSYAKRFAAKGDARAGSAVDECADVYDDDKVIVAVVSDSEGEDDNSSYYSSCDGVEGNTEIKLPSEVWGMVLDCKLRSVVLISIVLLSFLYLTRTSHFISKDLPYESVISFALTSHSNLYDALPFVSALHIYKSSELRIGLVSKQLRDVRSISIYNLFRKFDGGDGVFNRYPAIGSYMNLNPTSFAHL